VAPRAGCWMMFSATSSRASSTACACLIWCLCRRRHNHQLRHAHAVEMAREGIPLRVIQRQHAHLGVTSTYLQGIDTTEIINTVHARAALVIPASAGLRL